jgi:hypothetical protein
VLLGLLRCGGRGGHVFFGGNLSLFLLFDELGLEPLGEAPGLFDDAGVFTDKMVDELRRGVEIAGIVEVLLSSFGLATHSGKGIEFEAVAEEPVSFHDVVSDAGASSAQVIAEAIELVGGELFDQLVYLVLELAGGFVDPKLFD